MDVQVLDAMGEAEAKIPASLDRLKGIYGLTDKQLAGIIGLRHPGDFRRRRSGEIKITPAELAGLAAKFDLPVWVFYEGPTATIRAVLDRDPDLVRATVSEPAIPGYLNRCPELRIRTAVAA